jgi:hypothetical protein
VLKTLCVTVTAILKVYELIVVMTCEYPVNRLTKPTPIYKSLIHMTILILHFGEKTCTFLRSITLFENTILSDASASPNPHIQVSAMFLLMIVMERLGGLQWDNFHTKFMITDHLV